MLPYIVIREIHFTKLLANIILYFFCKCQLFYAIQTLFFYFFIIYIHIRIPEFLNAKNTAAHLKSVYLKSPQMPGSTPDICGDIIHVYYTSRIISNQLFRKAKLLCRTDRLQPLVRAFPQARCYSLMCAFYCNRLCRHGSRPFYRNCGLNCDRDL